MFASKPQNVAQLLLKGLHIRWRHRPQPVLDHGLLRHQLYYIGTKVTRHTLQLITRLTQTKRVHPCGLHW